MKQRVLTAIAAFIIFIPFVVMGGIPFNILVYIMASIAFLELVRMRGTTEYITVFLGLAVLWIFLLPQAASLFENIQKIEFLMVATIILLAYTVMAKNKFTFDDAGFLLLTVLYVGMGFYYLMVTRDGTSINGLQNIFYVLLVIWTTDTGAYIGGRSFGKHKLWPAISPNKTVEGAVGGIISAVVIGIIFHIFFPFSYDMIIVIAVTVLVSIVAQIGDLVESAYKRYYDVKDSGKLLPGHGGILDRLDSLIFVIPLLHLIGFFT